MRSNYSILAGMTAGLNGLALAIAGVLYVINPNLLQLALEAEILAGLSLLAVLYFASVHQLIKRRWLGASAGFMAALSAANLGFLVYQTGGLDSPFYAFWLLGIVAAGLFGGIYMASLLTATAATTVWIFAQHQFSVSYMAPKLGTLLITAFAAGLAEWIHLRDKHVPPAVAAVTMPAAKPEAATARQKMTADILMSRMADGVVVVNSQGIIKLMNRAAEEMTGWDAASAAGLNYSSVLDLKTVHDEPAAGDKDPFYRSGLERKNIVESDLSLYSRSGRKLAVSISVAPIATDSTPSGYVAVLRDISKEKEAERQRSEFISTASHEMRTPVAAIEGYLALAMNPKVATIDDRAQQYLQKAHDNTKHLGALFQDLLSITKLEEGITKTHLEPVNISQIIKEVMADMKLTAHKKNLEISYASNAAGGDRSLMPEYYVLAEPERLREVITNLIDNAIKFTTQGGVTVGLSADPKIVTVRIADTGSGISPENIKHLFQKFYRVDNSATRTVGGTGLGLYLCRSIIELFNGRIWAESQLGKGSSFNFSLVRTAPPAAAPVVSPATVAAPPPPTAGTVITPQRVPETVIAPSTRTTVDGLTPAAKTQ